MRTDKMMDITFMIISTGAIGRVTGFEHLNRCTPRFRLKVLQALRNKIER